MMASSCSLVRRRGGGDGGGLWAAETAQNLGRFEDLCIFVVDLFSFFLFFFFSFSFSCSSVRVGSGIERVEFFES